MEFNYKLILITFVTSSIGAIVRILHENEKKTIKKSTIFLIYFCAMAIGYMAYEITINYKLQKWIGGFGIISGIISIDMVTLIIDKVPTFVFKWFGSKFDKTENNK